MTRNPKVLGLALAAVFAFAAIAASSASAAAFRCESANEKCILTGTTETEPSPGVVEHEKLSIGGGEPLVIECHGKFSATQGQASAATLTVKHEYSECTGGEHVRSNHCAQIWGTTTTNGDAQVHTECTTGSKTEIDKTGICTLTIGEQTPNGGIHYTNTGNSTVTVETTVTNVVFNKSNQTGNQFFCSVIPNGSIETSGKITLHCYEDKGSPKTGTELTTPVYTTAEENNSVLSNCRYEA